MGERKLWLPWFMGRWKWPGARRLLCYNPVSNAGSLPGEAHALIVGKADLMSTLAWKNGEFVFKDASLEQVIDELARWYNVEMMYDHSLFRESRVHLYEPFSDARRGAGYAFQGMEHPL